MKADESGRVFTLGTVDGMLQKKVGALIEDHRLWVIQPGSASI